MKVYFIYLHNIDGFSPWLYAFTDSKKLNDSFIKERKKDMFTSVKKEITEEEFLSIKKKYSGHILRRRGFTTKSSSSISSKVTIKITATEAEEIEVYTKEDMCMDVLSKHTDDEAQYFNDDIINALHILHYFEALSYNQEKVYGFRNFFLEGLPPFEVTNYSIDHFSIFMMLYGRTIDRDYLMKN